MECFSLDCKGTGNIQAFSTMFLILHGDRIGPAAMEFAKRLALPRDIREMSATDRSAYFQDLADQAQRLLGS
jgi:hypothetical protein